MLVALLAVMTPSGLALRIHHGHEGGGEGQRGQYAHQSPSGAGGGEGFDQGIELLAVQRESFSRLTRASTTRRRRSRHAADSQPGGIRGASLGQGQQGRIYRRSYFARDLPHTRL